MSIIGIINIIVLVIAVIACIASAIIEKKVYALIIALLALILLKREITYEQKLQKLDENDKE